MRKAVLSRAWDLHYGCYALEPPAVIGGTTLPRPHTITMGARAGMLLTCARDPGGSCARWRAAGLGAAMNEPPAAVGARNAFRMTVPLAAPAARKPAWQPTALSGASPLHELHCMVQLVSMGLPSTHMCGAWFAVVTQVRACEADEGDTHKFHKYSSFITSYVQSTPEPRASAQCPSLPSRASHMCEAYA